MGTISIPSTSITMFQSSTAPVGWTKLTTDHDCIINVRSGTPSRGGTRDFSTVFTTVPISGTLSSTSASVNPFAAQSPLHQHQGVQSWGSTSPAGPVPASFSGTSYTQWYPGNPYNTSSAGSSLAHNHTMPVPAALTNIPFSQTLDFTLKYVDVIVAQRN